MNLAFVTDVISCYTQKYISLLSEENEICVFLPENRKVENNYFSVRYYNADIEEAIFQRYDLVVFCAENNWSLLLPIMEKLVGVAIVSNESTFYNEILKTTKYTCFDDVNVYLKNVPQNLHWHLRNEKEILGRLEKFGLLTDNVKELYKEIYGVILKG